MINYTATNVKVLNEFLPAELINGDKFSFIPCSNRRTALHYSNKYRIHENDIYDLSDYLAQFHIWFLKENNIKYKLSDEAPESFKDLCKLNPHNLVIADYGSEKTIYRDKASNYDFRAVHDFCHLATNGNFSESGEKTAIKRQYSALCLFMSGLDLDIVTKLKFCKLFLIDTALQVRYYYETKKFVDDQKAFALHHMNNTALTEIIEYLHA